MAETSSIEWTDATWNPVTGCQVLSPGCKHCYAMKLAGSRMKNHHSRKGLTVPTCGGPVWNGEVRLNEGWLDQPLDWARPRAIFVCAHADLFYEKVPDWWIEQIVGIAIAAHHLRGHILQFLTKRSERQRDLFGSEAFWDGVNAHASELVMERVDCHNRRSDDARATLDDYGPHNPPPGLWVGVSVEDRQRKERIEDLRATPAWRRWVSAEPLLESLAPLDLTGIACVVSGGESGKDARPSHPDWHREIRDACAAQSADYGLKQWGEWAPSDIECVPGTHTGGGIYLRPNGYWGCQGDFWAGIAVPMDRVGKKAAGRLLDGVTHDGIPV